MSTSTKPWLAHYAPHVPVTVEVPDDDVTKALWQSAAAFPDRKALDFMGSPTTYTELIALIDRAVVVLRDHGVSRGDRVAIALPNTTAHVIAFYAVLRIGAVVVEHNPLYTQAELVHQLNDSGAVCAIFWDRTAEELGSALSQTGVESLLSVDVSQDLPLGKRLLLKLPVKKARETRQALCGTPPAAAQSWHAALAAVTSAPASSAVAQADDLAVIQYTGGTTGAPKGAMLTHRNLVANTIQGAAWTGANERQGTEIVYGVLPFFHAFGLTLCLTYSLRIGATLILFPKFDVDSFCAAQKKDPGTFLPAVPPMLSRLVAHAAQKKVDLTSFRYAISGAMPLSRETAEAWEKTTGGLVIEGYGMTETSPVALGSPLSNERKPGNLGLPFPSTDALIVDQDDHTKVLPLTQRGELLLAGPQIFQGYWNKPEETEHVLINRDGTTWIRTGDVVEMDEGGSFKVVDRIKEMIITGGFKVFPSQVEERLREMPQILDAAVVGIPGGDLGERVVAALILKDGVEAVTLEEVQDWCDKTMARYALPREIYIVEDLPRSQIGKVLRRVVRDNILADKTKVQ
ncbi:AMP-binding protein [Timonella sp. A28]|uniref:AMP-binding protein n=1 Tax=Timonella sp. A28 TaxID=3442640 RepID=UPI003EB87519